MGRNKFHTGNQKEKRRKNELNNGITVNELLERCRKQVEKGNGNKIILLSDDDEGNGFHTLFYGFEDDPETIAKYQKMDLFHDDNGADEVVILG